MCLAVPGMIVEIVEAEPPFNSALVEFAGVRRRVSLACVPDAIVGEYVLVHAGVAISRIHAEEAAKVLADLEQLDLKDEFADEPNQSPLAKPR
jgi:hydrogenase expression/formation protein HypC